MPTFPPPPLKFRTAGFPQYGFKISLSVRACPRDDRVKRAPRIPRPARGLLSPSRTPPATGSTGLRSLAPKGNPEGSSPQDAPLTPGVLGSGPSSVVSVHHSLLRPHPPVSQAPEDFAGSPLVPRAFAVRERRGDPRDLPDFPWRAVPTCRRPYPGGSAGLSRCRWPAIPGFLELRASRHPRPRLCQQSVTRVPFEAASFASCCGPCVCPALLAGYAGAPAPPAEAPCHSRFWPCPSPTRAGSQARWANGKSPIVGTCTRLVTTGSAAAP